MAEENDQNAVQPQNDEQQTVPMRTIRAARVLRERQSADRL